MARLANALGWSLLASLGLLAQAETVLLNTLEWPPYSGKLPKQGLLSSLLKDALAREGYQLEVTIHPWKQAVALAMQGEAGALGFFSASPVECAVAHGVLSEPIAYYQLALAQSRNAVVPWRKPADLTGKHIGVVEGYDNGRLIDGLIYAGKLKAEYSSDDVQNLHRLAAGRLDLAVVDKRVFAYHQQRLKLDGLLLHPSNVTPRLPLHVCFNQSPSADIVRQKLNRQLLGMDLEAAAVRYLGNTGKALP